jgi:tRNA (guanine-N7-)-methyltransferase
MGRRALPRIDPSIDVSNHLVSLEQLATRLDPQSLFERPGDLEIEVGSGKGLFLLSQSQASPDRNFLGNEISKKYAHFAAYRLAKHQITNARVVHGDGSRLFREILPDNCAQAIHVYFPDPWWKTRHHRRRLLQAPFVRDAERVLSGGGILHFWTDVQQLFTESCELIAAETWLDGPLMMPEQMAEHDMDYRTHFERRMRQNEHSVFRTKFVKPICREHAAAHGNTQQTKGMIR